MYIAVVRPFKDPMLYPVELSNEALLLLAGYSLLYYSDFNGQQGFNEFKYNVGWMMIGLIVCLIIFNMIVILKKLASLLKKKAKAFYEQRHQKRKLQKYIAESKPTDQDKTKNDPFASFYQN